MPKPGRQHEANTKAEPHLADLQVTAALYSMVLVHDKYKLGPYAHILYAATRISRKQSNVMWPKLFTWP